jgi:Flp pilus assembly protein TadD
VKRELLAVVACALAATACAPKGARAEAVDPAPWSTPAGKEQTRIEIAERLIDAGALIEALDLLRAARVDGSTSAELDLLTGRALYGQRLFSEAEAHLVEAARRLKNDPRPHRALGLLYADTDRPGPAIDALRRAADLDPNDAPTWNNLGYLLHATRRDPSAVPALQKAVSLDSGNPRYKRNLGYALFAVGRPDDALNAFRAAGPPAEALYNLGVAHELAGDAEGARAHYARALTQDPNHPHARQAFDRLLAPEAP